MSSLTGALIGASCCRHSWTQTEDYLFIRLWQQADAASVRSVTAITYSAQINQTDPPEPWRPRRSAALWQLRPLTPDKNSKSANYILHRGKVCSDFWSVFSQLNVFQEGRDEIIRNFLLIPEVEFMSLSLSHCRRDPGNRLKFWWIRASTVLSQSQNLYIQTLTLKSLLHHVRLKTSWTSSGSSQL